MEPNTAYPESLRTGSDEIGFTFASTSKNNSPLKKRKLGSCCIISFSEDIFEESHVNDGETDVETVDTYDILSG